MRYILLLVVLELVIFIDAARVVVGYENFKKGLRDLNTTGGITLVKHIAEVKAVVLKVPDHKVSDLSKKLNVRYVKEDKIAYVTSFSTYSDVQWNLKMINVPNVWDIYFPILGDAVFGYGVVVAVLDTGIDYNHRELRGKVVYCINTVGTRLYRGINLRNCADRNGHGTHVAGIIAASLDNYRVAGVVPKVRLIAVKALSDSGSGYYSDIAEGIVEAVKAGAHIAFRL